MLPWLLRTLTTAREPSKWEGPVGEKTRLAESGTSFFVAIAGCVTSVANVLLLLVVLLTVFLAFFLFASLSFFP